MARACRKRFYKSGRLQTDKKDYNDVVPLIEGFSDVIPFLFEGFVVLVYLRQTGQH